MFGTPVLSLLVLSAWAQNAQISPRLSLKSPYLVSSMSNENWEFGRYTVIDVRKFIRLTSDTAGLLILK